MLKEKISFIVPVYNTSAEELKRCLLSIMDLESVPHEIILIDDGSSEENRKQYNKLLSELNSPQIVYLQQENKGVSEARNHGLRNAAGKYVMFVDSDDLLISENFPERELDADVIVFDYIFAKGKKRFGRKLLSCGYGVLTETEIIENIIKGFPGFCWGILYNVEYIRKHRIEFDAKFIQCEDAVFNFTIMRNMPKMLYLNRKIYQYNYSTNTALNRWRKNPDAMIYSGYARYQLKKGYLTEVCLDNYQHICDKLSAERIQSIFGNAIDLCCAGRVTSERKQLLEKLMQEIVLPANISKKNLFRYKTITKKKWFFIRIIAAMKKLYFYIRKI